MIGGYHAAKLTRYQDIIDRHLANFTRGTESDADWNVLQHAQRPLHSRHAGTAAAQPEALGNAWFVDRVSYVGTPDEEMAALSVINPHRQQWPTGNSSQHSAPRLQKTPGDTIIETSYAPNRLISHSQQRQRRSSRIL